MHHDGDYYSKMISSVVTACYAFIFGLNNLLLGDGESKFYFLFMKPLPFYVILTSFTLYNVMMFIL